jgi:hypothetical protein
VDSLLKLYQQPFYRQKLVENGRLFVQQNQGTIAKIITLLNNFLAKKSLD